MMKMNKYYWGSCPMHQANWQIIGQVFEKETGILLPIDVLYYARSYVQAEYKLEQMSKNPNFKNLQIKRVPNTHNISDEFVERYR